MDTDGAARPEKENDYDNDLGGGGVFWWRRADRVAVTAGCADQRVEVNALHLPPRGASRLLLDPPLCTFRCLLLRGSVRYWMWGCR
jgi:hypothetical protein